MKVLKEEQWQEEVTSKLRSFEKSLIIALKEKGWDGKESEETATWTFAGGLFYSITVITTIGKEQFFYFKLQQVDIIFHSLFGKKLCDYDEKKTMETTKGFYQ